MEFLKNIEIWKIPGHFTILMESRNWKILKIREIIKIVITQSILELGPPIFAWKHIKVPFTATKLNFWVFHNFGVFRGCETPKNREFVNKITGPSTSEVIFYARDLKFCMRAYFS